MEGSGLCTRLIDFTSVMAGTVEHSLSLHASRQLSDKVLRYLKRVIVTPAIYRSFDPLKQISDADTGQASASIHILSN